MLPRRRPRQARAQATVDAIIQATARVLVEDGYDRASTNRIAQAAGVSIGSLYQYFPSKEALVAALVEAHVDRMMEVVSRRLDDSAPEDLRRSAENLVDALIAAYRVDPKLHHVLCQEVPKIGDLRRIYEFEESLSNVIRTHLHSLRHQIKHQSIDRAVFLLINAIPSVIRAAIETDAEGREDSTLASELTDMILRYLVYVPAGESGQFEAAKFSA
ncbi:MAG TPA: TetR/AcrR family transcriptional regulator [Polyangiales bacterium]|nr:TetR/AcrR family transcriptional regulator [Polyangiales bacterium]